MELWLTIFLIFVSILSAGFAYLVFLSPFSGLFPLLHIGIPKQFSENDIPDLSRKVALITGGNSGLGFETACHLARNNCHVIITCKTKDKCDEAVERIREEANGNGKVEGTVVDLSSLREVKRWVSELRTKLDRLDILILNAGVMAPPFEITEDGIESQFAINHVAHFLITNELLGVLEKTPMSRVVVVSSSAQFHAVPSGVYVTKAELNDSQKYDRWLWYGQSKLANILFTKELAKRVRGKNIYVNAIHPGSVATNLTRHAKVQVNKKLGNIFVDLFCFFEKHVMWSAREAALTQVFAATSPKIIEEQIQGEYFIPIARKSRVHPIGLNQDLQKQLWIFTEDLIKKVQ